MAESKVFAIGRFRKPAGRIALEDGTEHDVIQIKSHIYHTLNAARGEGLAYIDALHAAVRELVPTLSDQQAGELTANDENDIVAISGLGVEAVEKMYADPNVASPPTSTSAG